MADTSHAWRRELALVAAIVSTAIACIAGPRPRRTDIAIIEKGDATIHRIDRTPVRDRPFAEFEVQPGGHTMDVTATRVESGFFSKTIYESGLLSLCLKARGGNRYRIKARVTQGRMRVFVIDAATGQPPVTPCGPDEDDD